MDVRLPRRVVSVQEPMTTAPTVGSGGMVTSASRGVGNSCLSNENVDSASAAAVALHVSLVVSVTVVLARVVYVEGE